MNLNKTNIKIILIIFIIFIINNYSYSIEKPTIKTGINSYGFFGLYNDDQMYPTTLKDDLFTVFQERFSSFFSFRHRTDLFITSYNKYSDNLEDLKSMLLFNTICLNFYPAKKNEITFMTKPMVYYYNSERYFKLMDKIQYKLNFNNFIFKTSYSHQYSFKINEIFYHNYSAGFYWKIPKKEFIKFKTLITIYFQHYVNDNRKNISPVKSAVFNFEIAIDFNKLSFEELFDKNEDNEFFDDNNNLDFFILSSYN